VIGGQRGQCDHLAARDPQMPRMRGIFEITESRAIAINGGAPSAFTLPRQPDPKGWLRAGPHLLFDRDEKNRPRDWCEETMAGFKFRPCSEFAGLGGGRSAGPF